METVGLLFASREIGLAVKPEKTKYLLVSCEKNTGKVDNMKICNKSVERMEYFVYLVTTVTN
jgi:hypothetical protein